MYVVGCDFSSFHIDLVRIHIDDLTPPEWERYSLTGQDAFDRTRDVADVMPKRTSEYWADVLAVGIEEPTGKFKPGLGYRVQGAVLAMMPLTMLVKPWPPTAWRKAVGLAGNASKDSVFLFAWNRIKVNTAATAWPQDAADAYCIALATRAALETQAT